MTQGPAETRQAPRGASGGASSGASPTADELQLMLLRRGRAVPIEDCEVVLSATLRRYRSRGATPKVVILGEAAYIAESL